MSSNTASTVLQLVSLLENEDYRQYSRRLRALLERLDKYDPQTFDRILNETEYRQRMLASLRRAVERLKARNPVIISRISDYESLKIYQRLLTGLGGRDWPLVDAAIQELGFGPNIGQALQDDPSFRHRTFTTIRLKIDAWLEARPWLMPNFGVDYMEDRQGVMDPATRFYIQNELRLEMDSSDPVKSLRYNALVSNPETIVAAEHELGLPITGNRLKFEKNYNGKYYTSNCRDYNTENKCRQLIIENGPLEGAVEMLRTILESGNMGLEIYGKIPRYDAIDQLLADETFVTQSLSHSNLLAEFILIVADSALGRGEVDLYHKYLANYVDYLQFLKDQQPEYRPYSTMLKIAARRLFSTSAASGNFDVVAHVLEDMKHIHSILDVPFDEKTRLETVNFDAAKYGFTNILDKLKELGQYDAQNVIDGAIRACNPKTLEYIKPDIDQNYKVEIPNQRVQLLRIAISAGREGCFPMFLICYEKLKDFPKFGLPDNITLKNLEFYGQVLKFYLDNYIDSISDKELQDYFLILLGSHNTETDLELMLSYPRFLHHIQDYYGSVMAFILDKKVYVMDTEYVYRMIVKNEYDPPSFYPSLMKRAILTNNPTLFRVYLEYYTDQGVDLSSKDYEMLEAIYNKAKQRIPDLSNQFGDYMEQLKDVSLKI